MGRGQGERFPRPPLHYERHPMNFARLSDFAFNSRLGAFLFLVGTWVLSVLMTVTTLYASEHAPWWITALFGFYTITSVMETYFITVELGFLRRALGRR